MKNEKYPLAGASDPDFDKPHPYTKCYGDGSIRHHCRCERHKDDPIHITPTTTPLPGETDSNEPHRVIIHSPRIKTLKGGAK